MTEFWVYFLIAFVGYTVLIQVLKYSGVFTRYNIKIYGPIMLIRTFKGQKLLDSLAHFRRFWRIYSIVGIPLVVIGMASMLASILFVDYIMLTSTPRPSAVTEPRNILLLPGVNEFVPLSWGIIGLVVTIVVHELAHGILCRVENIRVKSMGVILALVPIAAFVEPEDKELFGAEEQKEGQDSQTIRVATRGQRTRILSAGVITNFLVAFIAFAIFFGPIVGSISVVGNLQVMEIDEQSDAYMNGVRKGAILSGINSYDMVNADSFVQATQSLSDGERIRLRYYLDGEELEGVFKYHTATGVIIFQVMEGYPSDAVGLKEGMIITSVDGVKVNSIAEFTGAMSKTSADQDLTLTLLDNGRERTVKPRLATHPSDPDRGFLGVVVHDAFMGMIIGEYQAGQMIGFLKVIPSELDTLRGWVSLQILPLAGFRGFSEDMIPFLRVEGVGNSLGIFFFYIANILFWIGWISLAVGLFNTLPAVPLDGGHIFRELVSSVVEKLVKNKNRQERISKSIVNLLAIIIFSSLFFMVVAPYVRYS